jgi:hypothetical protein
MEVVVIVYFQIPPVAVVPTRPTLATECPLVVVGEVGAEEVEGKLMEFVIIL